VIAHLSRLDRFFDTEIELLNPGTNPKTNKVARIRRIADNRKRWNKFESVLIRVELNIRKYI
jgi:hypothetical protein